MGLSWEVEVVRGMRGRGRRDAKKKFSAERERVLLNMRTSLRTPVVLLVHLHRWQRSITMVTRQMASTVTRRTVSNILELNRLDTDDLVTISADDPV